jgi:hypothetical protein
MFLGDLPLYSVYGKTWAATLVAGPSWFRFRLVQRCLLHASNDISFTLVFASCSRLDVKYPVGVWAFEKLFYWIRQVLVPWFCGIFAYNVT